MCKRDNRKLLEALYYSYSFLEQHRIGGWVDDDNEVVVVVYAICPLCDGSSNNGSWLPVPRPSFFFFK